MFSTDFFQNQRFLSTLQDYLQKEYNVDGQILSQDLTDGEAAVHLELSGTEFDKKNASDYLKELFETIQTKIYNNQETDKTGIVAWSKTIHSDCAINIIQRIFDNQNVITVWKKTDALYGYYMVDYFSSKFTFHVSEQRIDNIINNEIAYVKDILISDFDQISTNFRKELNQFIDMKKQHQREFQTMAIIYHEYPLQTEMKISFFGQKTLVNIARKQLQHLLYKHRIRTVHIELDSQLTYDVHELKNIELNYEDDNVKIQIREHVFHAPQYLTAKIRQLIYAIIFQTTTISFSYIGNSDLVSASDRIELERISRKYDCEIMKIDIENRNKTLILPKANTTSTIKSTSTFIIEESNQFSAGLKVPVVLSTVLGGIEIHRKINSTAPRVDINVLCGNEYSETEIDEKSLFVPWTPLTSNEADLEHSLGEFVSNLLTRISNQCDSDIKRIAIPTNEWESYRNKEQLANSTIRILKSQLETDQFRHYNWTILLIFDENQLGLYDLFSQVVVSMQSGTNDYTQFYYPVSTIQLQLKTSQNYKITKCRNVIENYFRKHIIMTVEIKDAFDSKIWNQYMINTFFKYCVENSVLPKFYSVNTQTRQRLSLIGGPAAVHDMKQRYEIMSEIVRLKTSLSISTKMSMNYHMSILCAPEDEDLSNRLRNRLIDDGLSVNLIYVHQLPLSIDTELERTHLILVYFSGNYAKNENCIEPIKLAKACGKKIVAISPKLTGARKDNRWLNSMIMTDLYYELFQKEIQFRLNENFGIEYDKLLLAAIEFFYLMFFGTTEQTCPQLEEQLDQQQEVQAHITTEQRLEREQAYSNTIETMINKNRIPNDELAELMQGLTVVLEDCKSENHLDDFALCIERWINKAAKGDVIRGNLPPFTLTGDFNNSPYPVPWLDKTPWWETTTQYSSLNHSTPPIYFRYPPLTMGSWFNEREANKYFQTLIDRDFTFRAEKRKHRRLLLNQSKSKESSRVVHKSKFTTELQEGHVAWDIPADVLIDQKVNIQRNRIGDELKTDEELQKLLKLDDPNNRRWQLERPRHCTREFIRTKLQNIIELQQLCNTSINI